jgi:chromosome segregation ATPase
MSGMEQKLAASQSHLERCKQALSRHERQENELRIALQRIEDQVEELSDALDRDSVEDGRLEALKAALRDAEEEKRLSQSSYDDSLAAMSGILEKLKVSRRELRAKEDEIAAFEEQFKIAEHENSKVEAQRRKALGDKNAAIVRVDDLKQDKARIVNRREQIVARILDYSEKASMVSPRVTIDEGETPNSLDQKLDRLHKDLQRYHEQ